MFHSPPKQMVASAATANTTTIGSDGKPIKLRAACNSCFSAKVRCDGNKASCKRCVDKRITCVYSESRVGKVVGKRRKRPVDDSIGTVNSDAWVVHQQNYDSMPSPAATNSSSESSSKRHCSEDSWTYFIADDQIVQEGSEASEALQSIDMVNRRGSSVESDINLCHNVGLQTPQVSPPPVTRYLSPAVFEAHPMSRSASISTEAHLPRPASAAPSVARSTDLSQPEDEETVCIKLLSHLKKHSNITSQDRTFQVDLLTKSNASIRRILRSKSVRSDESCQLLLSNILGKMTTLCEHLCYTSQSESANPNQSQAVPGMQRNSEAFDMRTGLVDQQTSSETLRPLVLETSSLAADVGNMLKRKPLDGFQTYGRWETLVIGLECRLGNALGAL